MNKINKTIKKVTPKLVIRWVWTVDNQNKKLHKKLIIMILLFHKCLILKKLILGQEYKL